MSTTLAIPGARRQVGICISIHGSEIMRLYADKAGPTAFNQYLLEKFRIAGAPVEGVVHLKLAHGAIARVKPKVDSPTGTFQYVWMTDEQAAEQRVVEKQAADIAAWNARRS